MSYISADLVQKNRKEHVVVWERNKKGNRVPVLYKPPYYFFKRDPDGEYVSIYNERLSKIEFSSGYEYNQQVRQLRNNPDYYEIDIQPQYRVLSDNYYNAEAPLLHITFLDIEVDYNKEIGFANGDSYNGAYAPINSIALDHYWSKERILICVPPEGQEWDVDDLYNKINEVEPVPGGVEIYLCENEHELLKVFITLIQDSDVLCGWNSDFFDLPYIGWRLIMMDEQISGLKPYPAIKDEDTRPFWSGRTYAKEYQHRLKWFCQLSFPEANPPSPDHTVKVRQKNTGQMLDRKTIHLHGRIKADYLDLFKKYEMAERPSYKLESIADEILPTLRKMEYDGSLADLYRTNFPYFVRYNIRDTEILSGFEDKLGYVALANTMYHISCGTFDNVLGTIKLAELAIQNYCHHELNQRVPSNKEVDLPKNEQGETEGIAGAFVLNPKVGMHDWIGSIDINSLYPSSIRSINISPETLIGQFRETTEASEEIAKSSYTNIVLDYDDELKSAETHTAEEWREILKENKWAVSGYGTVFDQHKKGIIPTILEEWFATRKKYQKMMREETNKDKKAYYDRLQYVYKIKLNSLYGALTNPFFKFFDLRMGESTTGTGRVILLHQCAKANEMLTGIYDSTGEAVIYGDTDSTYFTSFAENEQEAIEISDVVASRVNDSFQKFMQDTFLCQPGFDDIIKAGREIVASRGIFVKKKRYILRVVDSEGTKVDKLKVMGLDTKKTIIPKEVGNQLNEYIGRLLRGEEWNDIAKDIVDFKEYIRTTDNIMAIGLPKGVQKVEHYTNEYNNSVEARLPGHVAAAIHYNLALEQHGDRTSEPIISGMKIKVFYLTERHGKFKSIALPTDLNQVPDWFVDYYTIDREAHVQRLVDKPLSSILQAAKINLPNPQSAVVNSLLEF